MICECNRSGALLLKIISTISTESSFTLPFIHCIYNDGSYYTGDWKDSNMHGYGVCYNKIGIERINLVIWIHIEIFKFLLETIQMHADRINHKVKIGLIMTIINVFI